MTAVADTLVRHTLVRHTRRSAPRSDDIALLLIHSIRGHRRPPHNL
ncbi:MULTISPECIES: hypothetical protein [Streptomyces]|nr:MULTISPECIES: hypothetical protein [Streptomyces]MDX3580957.1 hypothetical protein [Streptomyces europaeiscabiei]WUD37544.1 hypothetical protein OG858_43125 [Streptomyces europaeiscabiei]